MSKKLTPEKTLANILQQDSKSVLAFIQDKVLQLAKLNQIWKTEIFEALAEHTRIANFRDGYLVIECASAAWATHLRYLLPDITTKLIKHPELRDLTHIESNIQPRFHKPNPQVNTIPLALSSTSAQLLRDTANRIKEKTLQKALLRIAQHEK